MFDTELNYFKDHQDDLVARFGRRVLVIRGREVVGDYKSALDAYVEALKRFEPGTFMLQPCEPGPSAYTVTIASSITG
jgi:hypothetical protein